MIKLTAENFQSILNQNDISNIFKLTGQIKNLREGLNNPENQSFYFRQGIASNRNKLAKLSTLYRFIRRFVNNTSVEEIDVKISEMQEDIARLKVNSFIHMIALKSLNKQLKQLQEIRKVKQQFKYLPALKAILTYH